MERGNPLVRLIERLDQKSELTSRDRSLLQAIPVNIRSFSSNEEIAQRGNEAFQCCLPLNGQLVQSRVTNLYKRQILSFHVPGQLLGMHTMFLGKTEHTITSMGRSVVGFISHGAIVELLRKSPALANAILRETLIENSISHEWAIRLGHREGTSRVAHLICEMAFRCGSLRNGATLTFDVPWTQLDVGDACGLSNVHVNRIIQTFRFGGIIEWKSRVLKIRKWHELVKTAEFSADYLQIWDGNRFATETSHSGHMNDAEKVPLPPNNCGGGAFSMHNVNNVPIAPFTGSRRRGSGDAA